MADKTTSQTQHPAESSARAAEAPFAAATGNFRKLADEQLGRVQGMHAEWARLEQKSLEQSQTAVDEMARLTKATFGYWATLGSEWRRMSLDAARRTTDLLTPSV